MPPVMMLMSWSVRRKWAWTAVWREHLNLCQPTAFINGSNIASLSLDCTIEIVLLVLKNSYALLGWSYLFIYFFVIFILRITAVVQCVLFISNRDQHISSVRPNQRTLCVRCLDTAPELLLQWWCRKQHRLCSDRLK